MAPTTTAAAPAKPDAERARKKPRLAPSTTAASANTAASSVLAAASGSRLKSGLAPPTAVGAAASASSRLHYAFGSRLPPLAGKENAPTNSAKPTAHAKHDALKKPESALKQRRTKKRGSLSDEPTAPPSTATKTATPAAKTAKATATTPSTPASSESGEETRAEQKRTPPAARKPTPAVALSPVKPVRFEATTATDPDFWKCRQQFARTAMLQLKDLENRLNALSESSSRAPL